MSGFVVLPILIALLIWLAAVEWTLAGIEGDPLLCGRWHRLPRWARILLALFAWPFLAIAVFVILTKAANHG